MEIAIKQRKVDAASCRVQTCYDTPHLPLALPESQPQQVKRRDQEGPDQEGVDQDAG
jgi:hypothetical protein